VTVQVLSDRKVTLYKFNKCLRCTSGYAVSQLVEALRYKPEGRVRFPRGSLGFLIDLILPAALCL
jgi:hypothetical protein